MKNKEYTLKAIMDENGRLVIKTNIKDFNLSEVLGILEYVKFKVLKQDEANEI